MGDRFILDPVFIICHAAGLGVYLPADGGHDQPGKGGNDQIISLDLVFFVQDTRDFPIDEKVIAVFLLGEDGNAAFAVKVIQCHQRERPSELVHQQNPGTADL